MPPWWEPAGEYLWVLVGIVGDFEVREKRSTWVNVRTGEARYRVYLREVNRLRKP